MVVWLVLYKLWVCLGESIIKPFFIQIKLVIFLRIQNYENKVKTITMNTSESVCNKICLPVCYSICMLVVFCSVYLAHEFTKFSFVA